MTSAATAPRPACHVSIIPSKRAGIGARFTSAQSASATRKPIDAAEHRQHESLEKELPLDLCRRRAKRLADANLARPLPDRDQHDVHHAEAAKASVTRPTMLKKSFIVWIIRPNMIVSSDVSHTRPRRDPQDRTRAAAR